MHILEVKVYFDCYMDYSFKIIFDQWLNSLYGRYSEHTVKAYSKDVTQFLQFLQRHLAATVTVSILQTLTVPSIRSWLSYRKEAYQVKSTGRAFSSVKMFFIFLQKHKHIQKSPFDVMRPPKTQKTLPRPLSQEQIFDMFENIPQLSDEPWVGLRDKAFFMLIYSVGLRINEALQLNQGCLISQALLIKGKGGKQRSVPFMETVRAALNNYLHLCPYAKGNNYPLFYGIKGGRFGVTTAERQLQRYRAIANLPESATPHALRHSCATHLIESSDDLRAVQELLGHASLSTTQIYTQVDKKKLLSTYLDVHPRSK
ncbi:MAG TPA: recombinase XerC [Holosporales bacterium]|nr:recombinase XerC [Holosporales bacterium]